MFALPQVQGWMQKSLLTRKSVQIAFVLIARMLFCEFSLNVNGSSSSLIPTDCFFFLCFKVLKIQTNSILNERKSLAFISNALTDVVFFHRLTRIKRRVDTNGGVLVSHRLIMWEQIPRTQCGGRKTELDRQRVTREQGKLRMTKMRVKAGAEGRRRMHFINSKSGLICITDWQSASLWWITESEEDEKKMEGRGWLQGMEMNDTKWWCCSGFGGKLSECRRPQILKRDSKQIETAENKRQQVVLAQQEAPLLEQLAPRGKTTASRITLTLESQSEVFLGAHKAT